MYNVTDSYGNQLGSYSTLKMAKGAAQEQASGIPDCENEPRLTWSKVNGRLTSSVILDIAFYIDLT